MKAYFLKGYSHKLHWAVCFCSAKSVTYAFFILFYYKEACYGKSGIQIYYLYYSLRKEIPMEEDVSSLKIFFM